MSITMTRGAAASPQEEARSVGPDAQLWDRALRAEWQRVRTTRTVVWMLLVAAGLPALMTAMMAASIGSPGSPDVGTSTGALTVCSFGFGAGLPATLLGILLVSSERRHRTMAGSLLLLPRREIWLGAKAVVAAAVGVGYCAVGQASALAVALPVLAHHGVAIQPLRASIVEMSVGTVVLGAFAGVWGVATGAVVRHQIAAVTGLTVYALMLESAVLQFVPAVGKWLPGGAQAAIVHDPATHHFASPAGYLLFAAWCLLGLALGRRAVLREDLGAPV